MTCRVCEFRPFKTPFQATVDPELRVKDKEVWVAQLAKSVVVAKACRVCVEGASVWILADTIFEFTEMLRKWLF